MERAMNKVSFTIIARSARIDPTEGGQLFVDIRDTDLRALVSNVGISECLNAIGVERCKTHFGLPPEQLQEQQEQTKELVAACTRDIEYLLARVNHLTKQVGMLEARYQDGHVI
jgi:hypothetical protein